MSNSFNDKLDEIFDDDYFNADQAKQAIRDLVLSEIVGEDEPLHIQSEFDKIDVPHLETDKYPNLDGVRQASRNLFRTHQRNKILKGE